jgi:hypothetical protein
VAKLFYVYRILGEMGETVYIGKGTGRRLEVQKRRFMSDGEIMRSFNKEDLAFRFEAKMIAKHKPPLNVVAGRGKGLLSIAPHRPYKPADVTNELFDVVARIVRTLRHKQRYHLSFDMRPTFERFVQSVAQKYGYDEFSRRLAPYNISVEPFPQVTAA